MKKTLLAAALCGCSFATLAAGAEDASVLSPVIVTATRTAITVDDALSSVTVLTREDIERLQPVSVIDLLQGLPGVTFAQSGGLGQQSSLFLRGTNSTHTLLLIDGVRVGTVSAGIPAFEQLPVEQIERIEVVRGPRSSLYGADAIGGVIQIFTRHGARGGLAPSLRVGTGSRGYTDGQFGLAGGDRHAWYNLALGRQITRGINACRVGAAEAFAGCFTDEPDTDAFRNTHALLDAGYRWEGGTELAATWLDSRSYVEFDGAPYGNQARNRQRVVGARLAFDPLAAWKVTLSAGRSRDDSHVYNDSRFMRYGDSRRDQASWQNDLALAADQLLTLGVDWQREHLASDTGYLADSRSDTGAFAQYQGSFGAHEVQLSLRHDDNQQFGGHTTGAAAWGYAFAHGLKLSASWGSAFHAPTFNDLYYPYGSGNPDLLPETSRSTELGLSQQQAAWRWGLNAYRTTIDQLIALDINYFPRNISRARIRGLEAQLGTTLAGWRLDGYLTLQRPVNRDGGANDGHLLPRRPQRTARIELDRRFGRFGAGAGVLAAGARYDDLANRRRLGGYATVDLRAHYDFAPGWQLQARLANAFDRHYETVYYFNQPGRSWHLTVRYAPGA